MAEPETALFGVGGAAEKELTTLLKTAVGFSVGVKIRQTKSGRGYNWKILRVIDTVSMFFDLLE